MAIVVNNKPNLEFSFLGGNLLVKDYLEEYDGLDLANYICVDYITYKGKIVNTNIIEITNIYDIEEVSFTLAHDGIHAYYRLVIPKIDKYLNSGQIDPYNVFYYNGGFYYTLETVWTDEIDTSSFKKVELSSLYKLLEKEIGIDGSNEVIYNKYFIFSYELVKKAFVQKQDGIKTFTNLLEANISNTDRQKRNILMMAIYAIEEYLKRGMLGDADIIVNTLTSNDCLGITSTNNDSNNGGCPGIAISMII